MRIVIAGPKGAGKSTIGRALAERLALPLVETDTLIEERDASAGGPRRSCREIFRVAGEARFRELEREAVTEAARGDWRLIVTGGSTLLDPDSRRALRDGSILIWISAPTDTLWDRATRRGLPPWLEGEDGRERFAKDVALRDEVVRPFADILLDAAEGSPEELAQRAEEAVTAELAVRAGSPNSFGELIRMTTFGESHGEAIGAIFDGVPPGYAISVEDMQRELDRRRPGQSAVTTQRKEADEIRILSGVFEGKATGAPIGMIIYNQDQDSSRYENIRELFRPGHADFTYYKKYGLRDHRGGGRSSARETALRVACGAIAKGILAERGVKIVAFTAEIGGIVGRKKDYDAIEKNDVRSADPEAAARMRELILSVKRDQDSLGGVVELEVFGLPAGLGDPTFFKLDSRLCSALMTIPATKGVEVGDGFALSRKRGSQGNDEMSDGKFLSNHAGGILGGISTGEPIRIRLAIKPTSSLARKQQTMDVFGENREIQTIGRHDPCVVPRAVPVVESMAALVLLDAWEIQERLRPGWRETGWLEKPENL